MSDKNFESQLFKAADKLRKNIDAAEYKHVVLGLIFLKYISDSFEELHRKLERGEWDLTGANPEDKDEYQAENVFWVPANARRSFLHAQSKTPEIGKYIDQAMEEIEKENPTLKWILPKVFSRQNLDPLALGGLIDLIWDIAIWTEASKSKDILGRVYEYFLGEFANAEGKKWWQFYTPKSIVKLLVEMIEPYHGRVYDPACGSGGMFVMSEKFIQEHQGRIDDIVIYGQESNQTTYRLCRMNLAIRGIDGSLVSWNNEWTLLKDTHPDMRADFVIANPPFNQSERWQESLQWDVRRQYGTPPSGNANFAWMQHMIYHLSPKGVMGLVLSNWSLSSQSSGEGEIRQRIVDADLVDCIVALPKQLFYNTWIPACLWFISRKKWWNGDNSSDNRKREWEILFIDASEMGHLVDRVHREFTEEDINTIADTYHQRRKSNGKYEDQTGFCKSAKLDEIQKHNYVLTPGRYVGITEVEDDGIPFEEKMSTLTQTLSEQMAKEQEMNENIKEQLKKIGFSL